MTTIKYTNRTVPVFVLSLLWSVLYWRIYTAISYFHLLMDDLMDGAAYVLCAPWMMIG